MEPTAIEKEHKKPYVANNYWLHCFSSI